MRGLFHFVIAHHWLIWPLVGQLGGNPFGGSGLLGGIFSDVNAALAALASWAYSVIAALGAYLLKLIGYVWDFIKRIVRDLGSLLSTLWNDIVKKVLVKIVGTFLKVRQWLSNLLSPVIRILKAIRALYDQYFNQFVKPLLKIIRQVRQVLQIFRLLGFKWAARLDADLARIENKIVSAYVTLRGYLNIATSWIQLIVDPLGILRRNPLFAAIIRSAPELRNLMDVATIHPQTQAEVDQSNRWNGWFLPQSSAENFTYYKQGQLPPTLAEAHQQFVDARAALADNANQQLG